VKDNDDVDEARSLTLKILPCRRFSPLKALIATEVD